MPTASPEPKKRINIELSAEVIEKLDHMSRKHNYSRNRLIRELISEAMARKEKEEFEQSMREGYEANYDFTQKSSNEWDNTLGDGL